MRKRIMFVVQKLSDGGAERVVSVLANTLSNMEFSVGVLIYFPTENEYELSKAVNKIYISKDRNEYNNYSMLSKLIRIRKILKELQADYVIPFLYFVGMHVQVANFGLNGKLIQTVRNDPRSVPKSRVNRVMRNIIYSFMWRGFVQNERQLKYFPKCIRNRMTVLPNPVSYEFFSVEREERPLKRIIAAGRLQPQKNFTMLIGAAKRLKNKGLNFRIDIYGEGQLKNQLNQLIIDKGVNDCCRLCGRSNDMQEVYANADLFVMTSNFEGMPNSLMEAMASGLPCISTDCPTGPAELIEDGINGFLVELDNEQMLAEKIEKLLLNTELAKKIGALARHTIKNEYSPLSIASRFVKEVLQEE